VQALVLGALDVESPIAGARRVTEERGAACCNQNRGSKHGGTRDLAVATSRSTQKEVYVVERTAIDDSAG
jgi:hypothetical protein